MKYRYSNGLRWWRQKRGIIDCLFNEAGSLGLEFYREIRQEPEFDEDDLEN